MSQILSAFSDELISRMYPKMVYYFLIFSFPKIYQTVTENQIFNNLNDIIYATGSQFDDETLFIQKNLKLIKKFQNSQILTQKCARYYNYIIIDSNFSIFQKTVTNLYRDEILIVTGQYYIKILEKNLNLKKIFKFLWSYEIYNVIIEISPNLYTWYPYENCGNIKVKKTNLSIGFENKIPKKLNCELRVSRSQSKKDQLEPFNTSDLVLYSETLSKSMGAPFVYVNLSFDFKTLLSNKVNIGQTISENNLTIIVGGLFLFFQRNIAKTTKFSNFVQYTDMFLVMPPRRKQPKWQEFIKCDSSTLILIILTLLVCGFLIFFTSDLTLQNSIFLSFQIFIQMSATINFKKFKSRIFLIVMLFAMLVNFFYLISLSSVFTRPSVEARIRNTRQFAESDLILSGKKQIFDQFKENQDNEIQLKLEKKFIFNTFQFSKHIEQFINSTNTAYFFGWLNFEPFIKNPEILEKFQIFSMYLSFLIPLRSHLQDKINFHLREIEEKGLRLKFEKLARMKFPEYAYKENEMVVILSVMDLKAVFLLWISGCVLSLFVFMVELLLKFRNRKSKLSKINNKREA